MYTIMSVTVNFLYKQFFFYTLIRNILFTQNLFGISRNYNILFSNQSNFLESTSVICMLTKRLH